MAESWTEKRKRKVSLATRLGLVWGIVAWGFLLPLASYAQTGRDERAVSASPAPSSPASTASHVTGASGASGEAGGRTGGTRLLIQGKYLHLSCARSLRDLVRNKLECFGNVYIRRPNELLTSDYAIVDLTTEQLHAEGNVVYFTPDMVIYGTKMDFNFLTETGQIEDGRIESDKFSLVGDKIERLAINHFRAIDGEYTTCRDCPATWKLAGHSVDLTVDGYAFMNRVFIKINEAPAIFLPAAVFPVKTRRQTGLLFPRFAFGGTNGFSFIQPFFWAISRSTDATLSAGVYSLRGVKGEGQFRYVLSDRSHGQLDSYYLRDKSFIGNPFYNRWALNYTHNIVLPWGFEQKLNYLDASDRDYPSKIGDIPGRGEPGLISEAGLTRPGRDVSVWVTTKRIRNLLTPQLTGFDPTTVQLLPSVSMAMHDRPVIADVPLRYGLSFNYSRFWRTSGPFDPIYPPDYTPPSPNFFLPGQTPIRRANRFNLVPELYYTQTIADVLEVTPSVQYRTFGYLFDTSVSAPTARGYLLAQAEVATSIERVFAGKVKHKVRPSLTYSNIPIIQQNPANAFIKQINTAGNEFDEFDIVPISNASQLYFVPLGNSLAYEVGNKFIFKEGTTYKKVVDVTSGQSINFLELRKPSGRQPLSRFYTLANVDTQRLSARLEYYYYPYINRPTYNLGVSFVLERYTRRLLAFDRSISFSYSYNHVTTNAESIGGQINWSINDYITLLAGISYSFPTYQDNTETPGLIQSINGGITYQSPSQCYRLVLLGSRTVDNPKVSINFQVPVNLTGDGFTNLQDGGGIAGGGSTVPASSTALPTAPGH